MNAADHILAEANGICVRVLDCYSNDWFPTAVLDDPPLNVTRFERAEISAALEEHFCIEAMLADDEWRTVADLHYDLLAALGISDSDTGDAA